MQSHYFPLLALGLGFASYAWVLNNGFISDDLVLLDQSRGLAFLTGHLRSAPAAFRLTSDLWFGALQQLFGYHAFWFYVLSIMLHVVNAMLLRSVLIGRGTDSSVATIASLLFTGIQNPAEAVAWLSAVNELLVAFFVLAALRVAQSSRYGICLALYGAALVSKESGIIVAPLLVLFSTTARQRRPAWFWSGLALLTAAYLVWFASLADTNSLINVRLYSFTPGAVLVLAYSLHKLAFPWIYLAILVGVLTARPTTNTERRELAITVAWLVLALCPYVFLVYDTHVPSRHLYLAAMPVCYLTAQLVWHSGSRSWRWTFVMAFMVVNIGYLWIDKDRQYVLRARTIHGLVTILKNRPPGCVVVEDFPENPWIAKLSARLVPGWSPAMITVNEPAPTRVNCPVVRWLPKQKNYQVVGPIP